MAAGAGAGSRVVVDANRVISALLSDGETRRQLFTTEAHLFAPAFLSEEIAKHRPMLARRSDLDPGDLGALLDRIFDQVVWVPDAAVEAHLDEATQALGEVDPKDVPYLACALAVGADAVWSHDRDFDEQDLVPRRDSVA